MPEISEPKVSVHGIPQSQYNQQYAPQSGVQGTTPEVMPPPPGGSGLINNIKQHWQVWSVGLAVTTIIVMIVIYRLQNKQTGSTDQYGNYTSTGQSGQGSSGSSIDMSALDAEYNQLIALQNQSNATLAGIFQSLKGGTTGGTTGGSTGGSGSGGGTYTGPPSIDPGYGEYGVPAGINMGARNWNPKSVSPELNALHWDTNEGVPIYDQPNSLGKVIRVSPFGQNITTTNFWTATGPLEYKTGTSWYQVQGGGYVPLWELMPEAVPTTQQGRQTIFPTVGSVPSTPFGNPIPNSNYIYNNQYTGISGIS